MRIDESALTDSLRRLATKQDTEGVTGALQQVVDACVDLFGVTGAGLMVVDEQDLLRYVAASDGHGKALEKTEAETGEGPCTESFISTHVVTTPDVTAEAHRWPRLAAAMSAHPVRAVLGAPVKLGAIPIGTLDVYLDHVHEWDDSERAALARYAAVIETTLTAALQAHTAGELAGQLQYALDYRVVIERAVGYLMSRERTDAVSAFNTLRTTARNRRTKIGTVAQHLLDTGELPTQE